LQTASVKGHVKAKRTLTSSPICFHFTAPLKVGTWQEWTPTLGRIKEQRIKELRVKSKVLPNGEAQEEVCLSQLSGSEEGLSLKGRRGDQSSSG
jgi:hypothetical protein